MKYLYLLILLTITMSVSAQVADVIEIDSNTFEPMKPLPFDKRFVLRIPIGSAESVFFVGLVKLDRGQSLETTIAKKIDDNGSSFQIPEMPSTNYIVKKGDKKNFLQIDFKGDFLLDPSQSYSILYSTGIGSDISSIFEKYHLINADASNSDTQKAQKIKALLKNDWNAIADAIKTKFGIFFGIVSVPDVDKILDIPDSVKAHSPEELVNGYTKTKSLFESRDTELKTLQQTVDNSTIYSNFVGNATLSAYFKIISKVDAIFNDEYKKSLMVSKEQSQNIYNLIVSNQAIFKEIIGGFKSINCIDCKAVKPTQLGSRIENIKKSISQLKEIENTAFTITQSDNSFTAITTNVRAFVLELQKTLDNLNKVSEINAKISETLSQDRNLLTTELINGNSFVVGFETRNKFAITPDFGLVGNFDPPAELKQKPMLIPYLGFHINFRYVDKEQDFRSYRKKFGHYFSAFVGWSLNSVENKDKGVSNFFGNSSLLLGVGYRLGNAVRVTYSRLLYYQTPAGSTDKSLKTFGLIGLSLDMGIKDLVNGLNAFFPAK